MASEMERLDKHRGQVLTRSGPASYVDTGGPGRPVLFVHGVGTSSYLWRNVIGLLDGERRCVAIDLPLHGHTPAAADQDFTLPGLARFVADCCDALELTDIDMVANDTGGAVTQVFAAGHAERLHTLTLTNCEAHNNVPPKLLWPAVLLAHMGLAARITPQLVRDIPRGKKRFYGSGYQDVTKLPDDIARAPLGRPPVAQLVRVSSLTGTGAVPRQPCAITSISSVSRSSASPLRKNNVDWIAPIAACTASRTSPSARSGRSGASRCTHSSM